MQSVLAPPAPIGELNIHAGLLDRARRRLSRRRARGGACPAAQQQTLLAEHARQLRQERTHIAREVHDVLAHTLGAMSVQLTSLDCRLRDAGAPDDIRERVADLHRLAGAGLQETGDAIRSLREQGTPFDPHADGAPLTARLTRLCDLRGACLDIHGAPRGLSPDATLTLYRAAQEALTNAEKHAPRASVRVALSFAEAGVRLHVQNGPGLPGAPSPLAPRSGRHGLQGMRERVDLIGGRLEVGPTPHGWGVTVDLAGA